METLHEMLRGEYNSTVELTFARTAPDAQEFTVTVLRHARHEYDHDLNSPSLSSPAKSFRSSVGDQPSPMPSPKKDVPRLRLPSPSKGEGSESTEATEEFDGVVLEPIGTARSTTLNELQDDDIIVTL